MLRELVAVEPLKPILREYIDGPVPCGYIRVKVEYGAPKHGTEMALFSGTDPFLSNTFDDEYKLFLHTSKDPDSSYLMKMGNMWVGRIMEIGEGVKGFDIGERAAGYGPLRNTQTVPALQVMKMKETMNWKEAVCHDPAQFALGGVRDAGIRLGDSVAVFGLGAIGLLAVQMARLSGASFVIAVDPIEKRRDAAVKGGADLAIDAVNADVGYLIKEATGKSGVDAAIETSGSYAALQQAIRGVTYGGIISVVGWYKECKGGLNFGREAHFNQPGIIFSRACSEPNRDYPRWSFNRIAKTCWDMLRDGLLHCEDIVDPVIDFSMAPEAYLDIFKHPEKSVKMGFGFI